MNSAIISVGSNIDPEKNIFKAKHLISKEHRMVDESLFIQTKPRGYKDQPDFLNGAFYISTHLEIEGLKKNLRSIEDQLGRIRTETKDGPRTIDLDIVVFNGHIVDKDYFQYNFVKNAVDEIRSRHLYL